MDDQKDGWGMKFSEFDTTTWPALAPYLDTCLLPITGLAGSETPDVMTDKAAAAGAWLSPVEQAFKGRTVTMPAFHYYEDSMQMHENLIRMCVGFRRIGFRYVVLVSGIPGLLGAAAAREANLILQPSGEEDSPDPETLRKAVVDMWRDGESGQAAETAFDGQAGGV